MNQPALQTSPSSGVPVAALKEAEDTRVKAAFVLFVTEQGDALFTRRSENSKHPGEWDLPGGGVDKGESDEEGARRETMEEIGVDPGDGLVIIDAQADPDGVDATTFLQRTKRFIPRLNPNEHDKYLWAQLTSPPEPMHDGLARTLHAQAALGRIPAFDGLPPKPGPNTSTNVQSYDGVGTEINREHDGPWMSVMSKDGMRVYVNKNLPHYADIKGRTVNVDDWLKSHEGPEWKALQMLLEEFHVKHSREPNEKEREEIYNNAHRNAGTPGEKQWVEAAGLDWKALQAWARGEESKLEKGPFENEPKDADVRPVPHRHDELAATDSALHIALDKATVREVDLDGRMHVGISNISKANVCPYRGKEIPNYEEMGLEPDEVYQLYRDPQELAKAAPTFNRVQLLKKHIPVAADDHQPDEVIGTTGSDAIYEHPYLKNSLSIWEQDAIDDVESGVKRELSCGYHYVADMTPGVSPEGERYDGVMRNIIGNHVAIVEEGRAGPDIVVGDSKENLFHASMPADESVGTSDGGKKMAAPTKFANLALQLTMRGLRPVMAKDAKPVNLMPIFADLTSKNFPARKKQILAVLAKEMKGKLAKDASLDHITELLDHLEHPSSDESVSGPQHRAMEAAAHGTSTLGIPKSVGSEFSEADKGKSFVDALPNFLRGKGLDEESIKEACDMAFGHAKDAEPEQLKQKEEESERLEEESEKGEDEFPPKNDDDEEEDKGEDNMPAHEGTTPMKGKMGTGDKKPAAFDQKVFDAAIEAKTKQIRNEVRQNEREIRMALDEIRPYVGELRGGEYETPKQVYRTTLKMLGVDEDTLKDLNRAAMRGLLKYMPKAGARPPAGAEDRALAMDAGSMDRLAKKFPGIERIKVG